MARASKLLTFFLMLAFAAGAISCCIPSVSVFAANQVLSPHTMDMVDHCGDKQTETAGSCEFEWALVRDNTESQGPVSSRIDIVALAHWHLATPAAHLPLVDIPLPLPNLRSLTPIALQNQLRI